MDLVQIRTEEQVRELDSRPEDRISGRDRERQEQVPHRPQHHGHHSASRHSLLSHSLRQGKILLKLNFNLSTHILRDIYWPKIVSFQLEDLLFFDESEYTVLCNNDWKEIDVCP